MTELAPYAYLAAFVALMLIFARYITRNRAGDYEAPRPRRKPFNDPGGYAAHGDWPFVPSDLKVSRFHERENNRDGF